MALSNSLIKGGGERTMKASCQHYRFFATTYLSPHSPEYPSFHLGVRLIEWCEHPNSPYPKNGKQEKLPCGGDLEKCTLFSEGGRTA